MNIFRYLLTNGLFLLCCASGYAGEATETIQPKLKQPIQAIIPLPLLNVHMADPRVITKVQVDNSGKIQDLVVIYATHIGLVQRAENLLRKASFDTNGLGVGESIRFDVNLPFLYPSDLGLQMKTPIDDVEIMLETVKSEDFSVSVQNPSELDEPPRVLDRGQIYMPTDSDGNRIAGEAMMEFYVNQLGEVRLPKVLSSTNEEVSKAAIGSVIDMKFAPPTVDGNPMVTIVRMPFKTN